MTLLSLFAEPRGESFAAAIKPVTEFTLPQTSWIDPAWPAWGHRDNKLRSSVSAVPVVSAASIKGSSSSFKGYFLIIFQLQWRHATLTHRSCPPGGISATRSKGHSVRLLWGTTDSGQKIHWFGFVFLHEPSVAPWHLTRSSQGQTKTNVLLLSRLINWLIH